MSGLARSLAAYCADGLVRFWGRTHTSPAHRRLGADAGLVQGIQSTGLIERIRSRATNPPDAVIIGMLSSDAVAATVRFGDLLEFPEHPDKGNTQAHDDTQKHQRQARDCEHAEHPQN